MAMSCAQTVWQSLLTWGWMWKLFEELPIIPQPFLWMIREPGMENSSRERIAIAATIYWALIKRQVWLNPHNSQRRALLFPSLARWGNGGTWSEAHRLSVEELVSNPNFCDSIGASLVAQMVKSSPAMQETWVQSLGQEDHLEKGMVTHFSILPGKSHGQRNVVGYTAWGCNELDTIEKLTLSCESKDFFACVLNLNPGM